MTVPSPGERLVPFVDLWPQHAEILDELGADLARLMTGGRFVLGPEVEAFEQEWARYCGSRHCVAVGSGTDALRLALIALGVGPGSEVVTVAHTFIATLEAITEAGARPILVDVDPRTRCLDPQALAGVLGPATAAVVPVHLYGRPAAMDAILAACSRADVPVVEDAAQAHGATLDGRRAGAFGAAGAHRAWTGPGVHTYSPRRSRQRPAQRPRRRTR